MTGKQEKQNIRKRFSAKRLAIMAVFVALSYVVSFLEIPIVEPFKLDFGNVFILLIAFLFGPVEGVAVCLLKECLRMIGSPTGGIGELANMLMTCSYILLPAVAYRFKKGLKWVIPCLLGGCFIAIGVALLTNRFINFPLYMGAGAAAAFSELFWVIILFNLIKTVSVSVMTLLLYKRLSNFLKRWEQ